MGLVTDAAAKYRDEERAPRERFVSLVKPLTVLAAATVVAFAVAGCANPPQSNLAGARSTTAPPTPSTDSNGLGPAPNPSSLNQPPLPSAAVMPGTLRVGETPTYRWGTDAAGVACSRIDLSNIRAHAPKSALAALPAADQSRVISHDARSFAATVTAHDLTLAGFDVSNRNPNDQLLLIVNHGSWPESQLPVGGGGNAEPDTPSASNAPATADPVANWLVYVVDPATSLLLQWMVTPDDACFNGG
jgi:hypothetical protein